MIYLINMKYSFLIVAVLSGVFAFTACNTLPDSQKLELLDEYKLLYSDLSNLNTWGYKSYTKSILYEDSKATDIINTYQGALYYSRVPTDFAIAGEGFFKIRMEDDTAGYTRNGKFNIDSEGNLVNSLGYPFFTNINLGDNFLPESLRVTDDGSLYITEVVSGRRVERKAGQILVYVVPAELLVHEKNAIYVIKNGTGYNGENTLHYYQDDSKYKIFVLYGFLEVSNCSLVEVTLRMRYILSVLDRKTIPKRRNKRELLFNIPLFSNNYEETNKYIESILPYLAIN